VTLEGVLSQLDGVRKSGAGHIGRCPAHDDQTPSLSITERDGRLLLHCFAGCGVDSIIQALGGSMKDLFPDSSTSQAPRTIEQTFDYTDEVGGLLYQTVRYVPKEFSQRRPDGRGGWRWRLGNVKRVLYRLPSVRQAQGPIVIHEGEKAVNAAVAAGLPGCHTTTVCGAQSAKQTDFTPVVGKAVIVVPDNDDHGEDYVRAVVTKATAAGALSVKVLRLPGLPPKGDIVEWLQAGGTTEQFAVLLEHAVSLETTTNQTTTAPGGFAPISAATLLDEPEEEARAYVWEDYLSEGSLALLASKPKTGKSTLTYEMAVKVAMGKPFLGRATQAGGVLILAAEEHRRDVRHRLQTLGAEQLENLHVHCGPLADTPDMYHQLDEFIREHKVKLVIVDTLNTFWSVEDENSATQVTAAVKPLLKLARDTGAAVLLVHHSRKGEGDHGDEIRGSGALFSLLDVALILKRHDVETQRKLTAISRYSETPAELVIELRDHGYEALGDPAAAGKQAKLTKLEGALSDVPMETKELAKKAGVSPRGAYALLESLARDGRVDRSGTGRRNDPFRYSCKRVPPRDGTLHATKSLHEGGHFISCSPPFLGGSPTRNETVLEEVVDL